MGQLVPAEYSAKFESLCTAAPQTDYSDVVKIVTEELGVERLEDIFSEFDQVPVASASLA